MSTKVVNIESTSYDPVKRVVKVCGTNAETKKVIEFEISRESMGFKESIPDVYMVQLAKILLAKKQITWTNIRPPPIENVLSDYEKLSINSKLMDKTSED